MNKDKISVRLAYLIAILWSISFFVDLFVADYDPPPTIHALMMAVAGAFLAPQALKGIRNEDREEK